MPQSGQILIFVFLKKDVMNVENGFYDLKNDKVTIKVEFYFRKEKIQKETL